MAGIFRALEFFIAFAGSVYILVNLYDRIKGVTQSRKGKWLPVLLLCLVPSVADASCSGSELTWSCTAGSTVSQINTAISSASNGATITFATGSYSAVGIDLGPRNGVTLACASVGGCTFTAGNNVIDTENSCTGTITNEWRITGFNFTGTNGGTARIWIYCSQDIQKLRIDHVDFQIGEGEIAVLLGELSSTGKIYGVMHDNNCHGSVNFMCFKNISGGASTAWVAGAQGGANSFFFEDNRCTFSTYNDTGTGCIDVWHANSTVARFNTLDGSRFVNHSYCHDGPYNSEIYGNSITNQVFSGAPDYRNIHLQGSGEEIVWGNQVDNGSGSALTIQHFRSDSSTSTSEGNCNSTANGTVTGAGTSPSTANDGNRSPIGTYRGYPTWHQPGRDKDGALKPIYAWRNRTSGGTKVDPDVASGSWTGSSANCADTDSGRVNCHLQLNRDIYQAGSLSYQSNSTTPFNGTSGVGQGTLANRPSTCTPTSESADAGNGGVGYWASDQGTWKNRTPTYGVDVDNGVLYRCSATNTWTTHYTPYTYPHPLRGETFGSSGTTIMFLSTWWLELIPLSGLLWHCRKFVLAASMAIVTLGWTTQAMALTYSKKTVTASKAAAARAILACLPEKK